MGKGSKQRPTDLSRFNDNFDKIFNKDKGCENVKQPSKERDSKGSNTREYTNQD